jgi:hypothetical protein
MELQQQFDDLVAQSLIQIGQGLIHEQKRRARHESPGNGHPLLLAAGQTRRVLNRPISQSNPFEHLGDPGCAHGLRDPSRSEAKFQIPGDSQVRPQGQILEDHSDVALCGRDPNDSVFRNDALAQQDNPFIRCSKPGKDTEYGRLAASGWTVEDQAFSAGGAKRELIQDAPAIVALGHVSKLDGSHARLP